MSKNLGDLSPKPKPKPKPEPKPELELELELEKSGWLSKPLVASIPIPAGLILFAAWVSTWSFWSEAEVRDKPEDRIVRGEGQGAQERDQRVEPRRRRRGGASRGERGPAGPVRRAVRKSRTEPPRGG